MNILVALIISILINFEWKKIDDLCSSVCACELHAFDGKSVSELNKWQFHNLFDDWWMSFAKIAHHCAQTNIEEASNDKIRLCSSRKLNQNKSIRNVQMETADDDDDDDSGCLEILKRI